MPSPTARWGAMPVMSRPLNSTRPAVGFTKPVMRLMRVLLPEPFGPITPRASPGRRSKETSFTASTLPKAFSSPRTRSSGSPSAAIRRLLDGHPPLELAVLAGHEAEDALRQPHGEDQQHQRVE